MTAKRLLTTAALTLVAAVAAPAVAQAGAGPGDDFAGALVPPPEYGGTLPLSTHSNPHIMGFDVDTSAYGTEASEPLRCSVSGTTYGKTVWSTFKASQYGRLDVTAAGFDSVITLFDASLRGGPQVDCTDRLAGKIASFPRDELPTVTKGHTYYVQVGGATQQDGSQPGGPLSVDLELIHPDVVNGADAGLTYQNGRGGIKVTSLRVDGPRGSTIVAFCSKKCGKRAVFDVRKPAITQPIGKLSVADLGSSVVAARTTATSDVHAAAKQIFKGRKIKNGNTVFVAVAAPGKIGEVFFWRIAHNKASPKQLRCIEPDLKTIRAIGACNGA